MKKGIILMAVITFFNCSNGGKQGEYKKKPIIIAHRGAQSIYPEHTAIGFKKAIEDGADYIEPDLVMTKDGHLVVRHEPMLSGTTNVAEIPTFASLKTTRNIDGKAVEDWFVNDFTLAQIKQLKAKQARKDRPNTYDGKYGIPTFEEVIEIALNELKKTGKRIGIYPEMKHPYYHQQLGLDITKKTLEILEKYDMNTSEAPVFVQCFEVEPLQEINKVSTVKLVQLISCYDVATDGSLIYKTPKGDFISYVAPYDWHQKGDTRTYEFFTTKEGMDFVATYADGIGPWKPFIISYKTEGEDKKLLPATDFVKLAHKNNLKVHPYTFRHEDKKWSKGNPEAEYHLFFDAGVDGVFSDYTADAVKAVQTWKK